MIIIIIKIIMATIMMMIIVIIIVIIIMTIAQNEIFSTISSLYCELSPTCTFKCPGHNCVQIMCNTSDAYHVQHVLCHLYKWATQLSSFDRVEIYSLFYWLKPLTDRGGKNRAPREILPTSFRKCHTIQAPTETQTCTPVLVAGICWECRHAHHYITCCPWIN